jgi:hypothetical protein
MICVKRAPVFPPLNVALTLTARTIFSALTSSVFLKLETVMIADWTQTVCRVNSAISSANARLSPWNVRTTWTVLQVISVMPPMSVNLQKTAVPMMQTAPMGPVLAAFVTKNRNVEAMTIVMKLKSVIHGAENASAILSVAKVWMPIAQ